MPQVILDVDKQDHKLLQELDLLYSEYQERRRSVRNIAQLAFEKGLQLLAEEIKIEHKIWQRPQKPGVGAMEARADSLPQNSLPQNSVFKPRKGSDQRARERALRLKGDK